MQLIRGCQTPRETASGRLRHPAPVLTTGGPVLKLTAYLSSELKPDQELRLWSLHGHHHGLVNDSLLHVETSTCRSTTTGMSTSLSKNCFCTSGPEHLSGTCPHPCPRSLDLSTCVAQQRACQLLVEELQLRHLHCYAHLDQGIVVAHNGHDNLVQELHLWERHESAQFALCVPVVLGARTAGACRCMTQRRQPPSTVSSTMGTCRCTKRASQQPCPRTAPALSRAP